MSEETVMVDAKRFEDLCQYYSGDLLGQNKCKTVVFEGRLWTVTGICGGGNMTPTVELHELVPAERYIGPTGSYPFDSDGVFYKGQAVKARGQNLVMSGRKLVVMRTDEAPDSQLDLLDWVEEPKTGARKKSSKAANKKKKSTNARKNGASDQAKRRASTLRKVRRR